MYTKGENNIIINKIVVNFELKRNLTFNNNLTKTIDYIVINQCTIIAPIAHASISKLQDLVYLVYRNLLPVKKIIQEYRIIIILFSEYYFSGYLYLMKNLKSKNWTLKIFSFIPPKLYKKTIYLPIVYCLVLYKFKSYLYNRYYFYYIQSYYTTHIIIIFIVCVYTII